MRRMFSEKQIKSLVNEGIESEEIKLYEDMDISDIMTIDKGGLDLVVTKGYCSMKKTAENELYLVVNLNIANETESAISLSNNLSVILTLPDSIAEKIIDVDGTSVKEAVANNIPISATIGFTDGGTKIAGFYTSKVFVLNNIQQANKCAFQLRDGGSIPSNKNWYYTFRMFLTL